MLFLIIGKIVRTILVTHDKKLHKTQQRIGVTIARVVFVIHNLLHSHTRTDFMRLEFDLNDRYAVDKQNHIVTVVAVIGINTKLIDNFILVFAPIFEIDKRVL